MTLSQRGDLASVVPTSLRLDRGNVGAFFLGRAAKTSNPITTAFVDKAVKTLRPGTNTATANEVTERGRHMVGAST
jgi:hypothetical protein